MSSQKTIQDELKSLGSGLPVANSPVFSVPEGYFEGLAATVLAKVRAGEVVTPDAELHELSPLLAEIGRVTPYSVPSFYFDQNLKAASVVAGQEAESAILAAIDKSLPYQIPQGYFDALPQQILANVAEPKANVVPLFRRTWMRVTAAAAICGALVFGGLQILSDRPGNGTVAGTTPPAQTVQPQTAKVESVLEKEIKQASTKDLEEFIETVDVAPEQPLKKDVAASSKNEVAELLKDVSVNEMESFLSALPQTEDELPATN